MNYKIYFKNVKICTKFNKIFSHCQMKTLNNRYSVVGFGSDAYDRSFFCSPAKQIDRNMHKLGARRLQPMCLVSDTYVFHDYMFIFKFIQNESVLQVFKVIFEFDCSNETTNSCTRRWLSKFKQCFTVFVIW